MMIKTHQDMRVGKHISIWIGNISDELELDEYLSENFAQDFGFEIHPSDGPECSATQKTDVRILIEGFSGWQTFIDPAVDLAKSAGVTSASTTIVFYNFEYDPDMIQNTNAPVQFIGTIAL